MSDCPICLSREGFALKRQPQSQMWTRYYDCPVCGYFGIDDDLVTGVLSPDSETANTRVRATLSHWIRINQGKSRDALIVGRKQYQEVINGKIGLPTPAKTALSILRYIGDHIQKTGDKLESLPAEFSAEIGTTSRIAAVDIIQQLANRGLLTLYGGSTLEHFDAQEVSLTLDGWELYQSEQAGQQTAGYGFLAMKFGDEILETLTQNHLKPSFKSLGYELVDMRDVAQPGIIDNIMRARIRDSNFVIVDLTHDNSGAYWEAGYAEGLGKPVLYICEKEKFAEKQTHFDTNHSTTIMWTAADPKRFCEELIATLRRALPEL